MSILFIQKLLEKGIDLYKFGRHLGFNYDDSLEVGKKYFVRRGLKIFVKGTLSRLEMEIKKAEKWLCDAGAKCSEELFITIKSNEQAGSNRVLNAEVIIPYSGCGKGRKKEHCSTGGDFEGRCMEGLSAQWVREMDFGYCFSDQSNSEEKNIERVKNNLKDLIFTFGIAVNGTYWFKAKKDVFFNYSKGNVEVFICKKTGIY